MVKIILTSLTSGILFTVILGLSFGDVDDNWWMFMLVGIAVGAIVGNAIRKKYLNRKLGILFIVLLFLISLLLIIYGVFGIIFNQDLLSGKTYREMSGIIPYIAIIVSLLPIFFSLTIMLYLPKKNL